MLQDLKPKQQEMLELIHKADGPVTTIELRQRMGYRGWTSVQWHLNALERAGFLKPRPKHAHRMISLSEAGKAALAAKDAA